MCKQLSTTMAYEAPTQKCGYLEIKQAANVKPRKLKAWRRRWIVLTKMSDLVSEEYVARLDLYENESRWRSGSADKITFVLENVRCIQPCASRTRPHAFEIVEKYPVLVLSGSSELDSYSWILTLQQIFTPEQIQTRKSCYHVTVRASAHSSKWNLSGEYTLAVSPTCVSLVDGEGTCVISWGLSTLMKFNVEKDAISGAATTLVIECGPNAPTGHSLFYFESIEASDILSAIKQSICLALAQKQNARRPTISRPRTLSATVSEKNFQKLLDNHPIFPSTDRERSESESSNSTLGSPLPPVPSSIPPGSMSTLSKSGSGLTALTESDEHPQISENNAQSLELPAEAPLPVPRRPSRKTKSSKDSGYSEIKDVPLEDKVRWNTISSEPQEIDFDRLRSASAVVASLKEANPSGWERSERIVNFEGENDDRSDLDSAISSMALSTVYDESPKRDQPLYQELDQVKAEERFQFGALGRRRSSSTPDLQAYWKRHAAVNKFENVYEELDELRASVQRLNMHRESDTPPELPARPFSMSFHSHANLTNMDEERNKRSLVKNLTDSSKSKTERVEEAVDSHCSCNDHSSVRKRAFSTNGSSARQEREFKSSLRASKTSSKDELLTSCSSSLNDIYASIPEISLSKRRTSSDITPRAVAFSTDTTWTNWQDMKTVSLPGGGADNASQVKPQEQMSLINFDVPDVETSQVSTKQGKSSSSKIDPLISFFLDDDSFNQHPMVTGELAPSPPQRPVNFDLLKDNFGSVIQQPSPSAPTMSAPPSTNIGSYFSSTCSQSPSPLALGMPFTPFGFVNISEVRHPIRSVSIPAGHSTPFSSPFAQDPFFWNQSGAGFNSPWYPNTGQMESNYIPMKHGKQVPSPTEINPPQGAMGSDTSGMTVADKAIAPSSLLAVEEEKDIYISPSGVMKRKQCNKVPVETDCPAGSD